VFDAANNIFKTYVTQPFSAYHITNLAGNVSSNLMTGTYDQTVPGLAKFFKPYEVAKLSLQNKAVPGMGRFAERLGLPVGVDDLTATKEFIAGFMARHIVSQGSLSQEVVGAVGRSATEAPLAPGMPGFFAGPKPWLTEGAFNPAKTRGLFSSETAGAKKWTDRIGAAGHSDFLPIRVAEAASSAVDSWARVAHYYAKITQGLTPDAAAASTMAALFDYKALSPFEKNYVRSLVPFYCVPDDSKILTRDGWKTCDEVTVGEEVLTYNSEGDFLEWQPCQAVNVFDHNQSLMVFETKRGRNFRFTPNHRWPTRRKGSDHIRPYGVGAYSYPDKFETVEGKDLTTLHSFLQAAEFHGTNSILTPEQARRLGWLLTDGYHRWRGNHWQRLSFPFPQ
jgi:hypothetical protein